MSSKTPKVGPYGETFLNPRSGKLESRLTAEGKQIAADYVAKYPRLLALPFIHYPRMTRFVLQIEGEESTNALAAQAVVVATVRWEPERSALSSVVLSWTKAMFRQAILMRTASKRQGGFIVSLNHLFHAGKPDEYELASVTPDQKAADPTKAMEDVEYAGHVRRQLDRMPRRYAEVLRAVYDEGKPFIEVGAAMGYSRQGAHNLKMRAMDHLRWQLGVSDD